MAGGHEQSGPLDRFSQRLRAEIPGAAFSFTQPIIDNVTEAVTGSSADLAVIRPGPIWRGCDRMADRGARNHAAVPGAADTAIEQEADQAQLQILSGGPKSRGTVSTSRRTGCDRAGDRRARRHHRCSRAIAGSISPCGTRPRRARTCPLSAASWCRRATAAGCRSPRLPTSR